MNQFARFAIVGGLCFALTLGTFSALTALDVHYLIAGPVGYAAGVVLGFQLNRTWTFGASHGPARRQAVRFLMVSAVAIGLNAVVLHLLVDGAGLAELPGEVVTVLLIAPLTFTVNRVWSFRAYEPGPGTRICLVYDCLFPYTVGGAERWYRDLALRLRAEGHEVTFLTLRQWPRGEQADLPGIEVVTAGPRMRLYDGPGHRRILPPVVFGAGVLWHLLLHGRRYDVVHTASFPYFSLLAAAFVRRLGRYRLVVDWVELWTLEYWREYLGRVRGRIGWLVQRAGVRVRQRAFSFAEVTARRLREEGARGEVGVLRGLYAGARVPAAPLPAEPVVVFAGRHIPEKRAPAAVAAIAAARERIPGLRGVIFGDGPERERVLRAIAEHGLEDAVEAPGFADRERLETTLASALCLLHPSRREGYGLVVVESAAMGVPTVLADGPDNAATELVSDGLNGVIAPSASPQDLADAIVRVHVGGAALRASTAHWFAGNASELSLEASLDVVVAAYGAGL